MNNKATLRPCPFCGSVDALKVVESDARYATDENYLVVCDWLDLGCGACGGTRRTKAGAIAAWNSRTSIDKKRS